MFKFLSFSLIMLFGHIAYGNFSEVNEVKNSSNIQPKLDLLTFIHYNSESDRLIFKTNERDEIKQKD